MLNSIVQKIEASATDLASHKILYNLNILVIILNSSGLFTVFNFLRIFKMLFIVKYGLKILRIMIILN